METRYIEILLIYFLRSLWTSYQKVIVILKHKKLCQLCFLKFFGGHESSDDRAIGLQAPPMPGCRYVEEISSAAMLATKRSAGVTPEMNLRECVTHTPLPSANKAAHSGFETQRCHKKSKTGVSVAPQKGVSTLLKAVALRWLNLVC